MYDIDRKKASKLLKLSMRTIDRYIVNKKLSTEHRDGRIWLDINEIKQLRQRKRQNTINDADIDKSIDNYHEKTIDMSIDGVEVMSHAHINTNNEKKESSDVVYKKLFEELQTELKLKQERLEGANYRVGQLEAQLKESVPLLDYQRALGQEKAVQEKLQKDIGELEEKSEKMLQNLKEQKLDKKVYLIFLFLLILLQPLWLFLSLRQ